MIASVIPVLPATSTIALDNLHLDDRLRKMGIFLKEEMLQVKLDNNIVETGIMFPFLVATSPDPPQPSLVLEPPA